MQSIKLCLKSHCKSKQLNPEQTTKQTPKREEIQFPELSYCNIQNVLFPPTKYEAFKETRKYGPIPGKIDSFKFKRIVILRVITKKAIKTCAERKQKLHLKKSVKHKRKQVFEDLRNKRYDIQKDK